MIRRPARAGRGGFISSLAVMTMGVLLMIVAILGRYTVFESRSQLDGALAVRAEQILLSARDWSHAHVDELRTGGPIELPIDEMIDQLATGRLELEGVELDGGGVLVTCALRIEHGRLKVSRQVTWMLGKSGIDVSLTADL